MKHPFISHACTSSYSLFTSSSIIYKLNVHELAHSMVLLVNIADIIYTSTVVYLTRIYRLYVEAISCSHPVTPVL